MLIRAIVHKEGGRVLLEVPAEDPVVERLKDGDEITLQLRAAPPKSNLGPEIEAIARRIIKEHREALEHLAEHD